jgi:hypothetical protein
MALMPHPLNFVRIAVFKAVPIIQFHVGEM